MRISLRFISFGLWAVALAFGAEAPSALPGGVFSFNSLFVAGLNHVGTVQSQHYFLFSDGTYVALSGVTLSGPDIDISGQWKYEKISVSDFSSPNDPDDDPLTAKLTVGRAQFTLRFSATNLLAGQWKSLGAPTAYAGALFSMIPAAERSRLANCSSRSFVPVGGVALTGFVLSTNALVFVRAIGPGLASFGINDALRHPALKIVSTKTRATVGENNGWGGSSSVIRMGALVGAFPLAENSKDSAVVVALEPGAYTAQVSSLELGDSGQALIEVYILP